MKTEDIIELEKKIEKFETIYKGFKYDYDLLRSGKEFVIVCPDGHMTNNPLKEHLKIGGCLTCIANKARINRLRRNRAETAQALSENFTTTFEELLSKGNHEPLLVKCNYGHETMTTITDIDDECISIGEHNHVVVKPLTCDECEEQEVSKNLISRLKSLLINLNFKQEITSQESVINLNSTVTVTCQYGHKERMTVKDVLELTCCPTCKAIDERNKHEHRKAVRDSFITPPNIQPECVGGHVTLDGYCGICSGDLEIDEKTLLPHLHSIEGHYYGTVSTMINIDETLHAVCPEHGVFETTARNVMNGIGKCPYCNWNEMLDTVCLVYSEGLVTVKIGFEDCDFTTHDLVDPVVVYRAKFEPGEAKKVYDQLVIALANLLSNDPYMTDVSATYQLLFLPEEINTVNVNRFVRDQAKVMEILEYSLTTVDDFKVNVPIELQSPSF